MDRRDSVPNSILPRQTQTNPSMRRIGTNKTSTSYSSGFSNGANEASSEHPPRRLVIFLPGTPPRYLTINLSGLNDVQFGHDSNKKSSNRHITIRSVHKRKFCIGNFSSDKDYPAIPLDPKVLLEKENFQVNWVEIEFQHAAGLKGLNDLCEAVSPTATLGMTFTMNFETPVKA